MGKYLKLFKTHAEYELFIQTDFDKPNVSYCEDNKDVHFNPVEARLVCKYNVTSISKPTLLRADVNNIFKSMEIDGVMLNEFVTEYTFDTIGVHTVKYELYDETNLGDSAFYNCRSLTSVITPNSVTSIGSDAFKNCTSLAEVTILDSVTSIGSGAFRSCSSLTSIDMPNSLTSIGSSAFNSCNGLTSIDIPNSVTSIGSDAFKNCTSLASVAIGSGVTSIGNSAFRSCSSLTSIDMPNSLTSIGSSAFADCSGLTSIRSLAMVAPKIKSYTFQNVKTNGTLYVPIGSSGYDVWMGTGNYYLGMYNWTKVEQ